MTAANGCVARGPFSLGRLLSIVTWLAAPTACLSVSTYSNADISGSVLEASAQTVVADGVSSSQLTLIARRADGTPLAGLTATFTGSDCVFEQPAGPTDANGRVSGSVRSMQLGTHSIQAQLQYDTFVAPIGPAVAIAFIASSTTTAIAGQPLSLTVASIAAQGELNTAYRGTVHFSASDAQATLPGDYTFTLEDTGEHQFNDLIVLRTAGTQTITEHDVLSGALIAQQTVTVQPAAAATFQVAVPADLTAGVPFYLPLVAQDAFGNRATTYSGTIRVSSSDANASLPPPVAFTANDAGNLSLGPLTWFHSGTQSLLITDVTGPAPSWQSGSLAVLAGPAATIHVQGPTDATAGQPVSLTLSFTDANGNPATFGGTLELEASDSQAELPGPVVLSSSGQLTQTLDGIILRTSGQQTLLVADPNASALSSATLSIDVASGPMQGFAVAASPNVVAGAYLEVQAQAVDAYGNTVSSYLGEVFTQSSDSHGIIPPPYTMQAGDAGRYVFRAVMHTSGSQTVTLADGTNPALTGSVDVAVAPAVVNGFRVGGLSSPCVAGQAQQVAVTAIDAFGNTVPTFAQTVHIGSTDANAVLPADATYQPADAGALILAVALTTAGMQSVSATQTDNPNITGMQSVHVVAAPAAQLVFTQSPNANVPTCAEIVPAVSIALQDAYGNPAAVAAQVALSLVGGTYASHLSGAAVQPLNVTGSAQFDNLSINAAGTYQLQVASANPNSAWTQGLSGSFTVVDTAPTVSLQDANFAASCAAIAYTVRSACPVDVTVEYDPNGVGAYRRATQAPGVKSASQGVAQVRASATGTPLTFAWDSSRDLPHRATNQLALRVTAATSTQSAQSNVVASLSYDTTIALTPMSPQTLTGTPGGIGVADFNHDGALDVALGVSTSLLPLLGSVGAATLAAGTATGLSNAASALAVPDINRDGTADVVATAGNSASVSLLLGTGNGTFAAAQSIAVPGPSTALAVGDVNRDGFPDIVTVSSNAAQGLSWLLQNPNGSFAAAQQVALPGAAAAVALADMNQDGIVDALVAVGNEVIVTLGTGNGFSATTSTYAVAAAIAALAVGDVNNDGQNDGAVVCADGSLSVLVGAGNGTLNVRPSVALGAVPNTLALADLDHSGSLDAIVGGTAAVLALANDGNGNYTLTRSVPLAGDTTALAIADVNLDGRPDIVAAGANSSLTVLLNSTPVPCSWGLAAPEAVALPVDPSAANVGDFDEDGRPDVAIAGVTQNLGALLTGNGAGGLTPVQAYTLAASPGLPAAADFNGDGHLDLAVPNFGAGTMTLMAGDGNARWLATTTTAVGTNPNQLIAADMNADGKMDWVSADFGANQIDVLLNRGDGTVASIQRFTSGAKPTSIAVADFNADGALDVVSANYGGNNWTLLLGDNTGQLHLGAQTSTCSQPTQVVSGNFNGDSAADFIILCGSQAHTYINSGTGTFTAAGTTSLSTASSLIALDINQDGIDDFATVGAGRMNIALGAGNGTFVVSAWAAQQGGQFTGSADFDGDGSPDILSLHTNTSVSYAVLTPNLASGSFYTAGVAAATNNGMAAADFNHDGSMDCVVTGSSNTLSQVWSSPNGTLSLGSTYSTGASPSKPEVADINRDSWMDVAVASLNAADTRTYFFSPSTQGFAAPTSYAYDISNGVNTYYPANLAVADINRDAVPDAMIMSLSYISFGNLYFYVELGNPNGTWGSWDSGGSFYYSYGIPIAPLETVRFADMDNNGTLDVLLPASASNSNGAYTAHFGIQFVDPNGSFGSSVIMPYPSSDAAVADFNHDGSLDVVLTAAIPYLVALGGSPTGALTHLGGLVVGGKPLYVVQADVNLDGNADLVVPMSSDSAVAVILGDGHGGFADARYFIGDGLAQMAAVADVNHDGRLDILMSKTAAGQANAGVVLRLGK